MEEMAKWNLTGNQRGLREKLWKELPFEEWCEEQEEHIRYWEEGKYWNWGKNMFWEGREQGWMDKGDQGLDSVQ